MANATDERTGPLGPVRTIITAWALLGGTVLMAVVLMDTWSVIGNNIGTPFPAFFELTEVGIAIAAFAFLPYCQMTGANVTADIFTARMPPRGIAFLGAVASLLMLAFAAVLLFQMFSGMLLTRSDGQTTAILQFPHWIAYIPCLVSLALLMLASVITLLEAAARMRRR